MKRTGIMNIKDILRHRHDLALLPAQIADVVGVSTGTVSHVLARAEAAGLSWPLPSDLGDEALRARLYPAPGQDSNRVQPDWDAVIEELEHPIIIRHITRVTKPAAIIRASVFFCPHRPRPQFAKANLESHQTHMIQ